MIEDGSVQNLQLVGETLLVNDLSEMTARQGGGDRGFGKFLGGWGRRILPWC